MYIIMHFSQQQILKNDKCKKVNVWDNEFIVYACGYVFKKQNGKWKLLNLNKKNNDGYIRIQLTDKKKQKKMFLLHRIVYYAFNQESFNINDSSMDNFIDHINGNPSDNRISNLRNVTNQHNQFNNRKAKGYTFNKNRNKYEVYINIDGKKKHLGLFKTKTGAKLKYLRTKEILHKITEL